MIARMRPAVARALRLHRAVRRLHADRGHARVIQPWRSSTRSPISHRRAERARERAGLDVVYPHLLALAALSVGLVGVSAGRFRRHLGSSADKGPSASLAPSIARSTYRLYASRAIFGRLAAGPFSPLALPCSGHTLSLERRGWSVRRRFTANCREYARHFRGTTAASGTLWPMVQRPLIGPRREGIG